MAILEKMRVKMGVFITAIIALALLAFIVDPETLRSTISMFSSKYDVGEIDGKGISSQDFQKKVDYYTNIYRLTSGTTSTSEQVQEMLNNTAWQNEITERVIIPACEKAGLAVGDKELVDMSQGADVSPVLAQEAIFVGEDGQFDKDKLLTFVQNISQDKSGNLRAYWDFLQTNMTNDRLLLKYTTLLVKSSVVNNLQLHRDIAENNTAYDVDFVVKPVGFEADSTITVSNNEIKEYYAKIKNGLRQPESRDAEFVAFEITPSEEDKAEAKKSLDKAYEQFVATNTKDLKAFIAKTSDKDLKNAYFKKGDLLSFSATLDNFVATASTGALLEPQVINDTYYAAKITDVAQRPDSVFIKYIPAQKEATADSLMKLLTKGAVFEVLAADYFPKSQSVPGILGWITEAQIGTALPQEFAKVFSVKAKETFKLDIAGNCFIVRVDQTTKPVRKAQVALLAKEAVASNTTNSLFYAKAADLVDKSNGTIADFEKYAREKGYVIYPADRTLGGAKNIAGFDDVKELSRWIFDDKSATISPVISINNKYFMVAALKGIHKEGFASINDVAPQLRDYLAMEKRVAKLATTTKALVGENPTSLEDVATKLGTTVSSNTGVTFSSLTSQQLDPKFIGAIAGAAAKDSKAICGPVEGAIGVYYFQIKGQEVGAYYSETDANRKNQQTLYQVANILPQVMAQDANVVDKRYRFY